MWRRGKKQYSPCVEVCVSWHLITVCSRALSYVCSRAVKYIHQIYAPVKRFLTLNLLNISRLNNYTEVNKTNVSCTLADQNARTQKEAMLKMNSVVFCVFLFLWSTLKYSTKSQAALQLQFCRCYELERVLTENDKAHGVKRHRFKPRTCY